MPKDTRHHAGPVSQMQLFRQNAFDCLCDRRGLWKLTSTMINFSDTMAETGFLVRKFKSNPKTLLYLVLTHAKVIA